MVAPAVSPVFSWDILEQVPGRLVARVSGHGALELFNPECGGHRWQRIPPTERSGRKQSSTITVAVLSQQLKSEAFSEQDVELRFCVASVGAGGQNRQKNATACQAIHLPTGISAKCEDERSQKRNKDKAIRELRRRVEAQRAATMARESNQDRRSQIGSGERGDKIRTIQVQNGIVTNHLNGKKVRLDRYLKGGVREIQ